MPLHNRYFFPTLFFVLTLTLFLITGVFNALPLAPQSIHSWAQSDRASVASIYYYEGMDFFHPRVYNIQNGTGYTGMEFPLINFTAACLYKLFGIHNFWYRFLVMCIVTAGAMATFSIACSLIQKKLFALFLTFLWILSPVLLYYTPNFLADAASLGFIMIAWLAFFKLIKNYTIKWILILLIFGACATLVKVTSSISILCMLGLLVIDYLRLLIPKQETNIPKKHWMICAMVAILLCTTFWYKYATYLSESNFSELFHLGICPPENVNDAIHILKQFPSFFLSHYYSPVTILLIVCFILICVFAIKKINRMLGLLITGMGVANCCFIYLQLPKYLPHDYYMLTILPWFFFLFITIGKLIEPYLTGALMKPAFFVLAGLVIYNTAYCKRILSYRYDQNNQMYYDPHFKYYEGLKPLLREIGVKQSDTIVTLTDVTPNNTLYILEQKGYSLPSIEFYEPSILFLTEEFGAKYVVCNHTKFLPSLFVKNVLGKPILQHYNIIVFKPKRNATIRHIIDSVMDAHLMIPYQHMKTGYWAESTRKFSIYLNLPLKTIERYNGVKWFLFIEQNLNTRFNAFKKNSHSDEQTLRANFVIDEKLTQEEKYVWEHPSHLWFNGSEHLIK